MADKSDMAMTLSSCHRHQVVHAGIVIAKREVMMDLFPFVGR